MRNLLQDLRYAIRMLVNSPGFAAVAVLTLALGIGANTAIFSVVNAALLRPLPYHQTDRLITLAESRRQEGFTFWNASFPDYLDWQREAKSLDSLAGFVPSAVTLTGAGSPESLQAGRATSNFLSTLGVKPLLGRDFVPGEDRPNGEKIVLLSYKFWVEHFAGNPGALGQTVRLDGESHTIIGVLPKEFEFAPAGSPPLWLPLNPPDGFTTRRNLRWLRVFGQLKHGVTFSQAQEEMRTINARLASAYPQENGTIKVMVGLLREKIVGQVRPLLLTLMGAVSFVLLIACANVANLLLARSAGRRKEIAIRMALGAGRVHILRQLLTESVSLAFVGGAVGLLLSQWGVKLLVAVIPQDQRMALPFLETLGVNKMVLLFLLAVTLLTGIIFGFAPALQMLRSDSNEALKEEGRSSSGVRGAWMRSALVIAELSVSLVLLMGAGLMLRSMSALLRQDPGFRTQGLFTFALDLPSASYKDNAAVVSLVKRLSDAVQSLPGVQGMTVVSKLPVTGGGNTVRFLEEGRPKQTGAEDEANIRTLSANYFPVLRIPLREGRFFGTDDTSAAPRRVIVNQVFAERYFPGEDALGKRIRFTFSPTQPWREIVGIVGNENVGSLDAAMPPVIYTPYEQNPDSGFYVVVRTSNPPESQIAPIRGALHELDAELPMIRPRTMEQIISNSDSVFLRLFPTYLIGSFAFLAVVLAAIGLFGVISFAVAQRTREIGIRVALGAQTSDVLRLIVGAGLRLAVPGLAIGVAAGLALTRLMRNLLFGVTPSDPWTIAGVAVLLTAVSLLASYLPARRAIRVDPVVALRYE